MHILPVPGLEAFTAVPAIVSTKLVGKKKTFLPKERRQAKFSKMFYEWYIDKVSLFSVKHLMESRLVKQPLIQNGLKILLVIVTWNLSEETVITFEIFQCF